MFHLTSPFRFFLIFNFLVYLTVFAARITRDTLLFTQEDGFAYLPWVLIVNAVLITWVGNSLDGWLSKLQNKGISIAAFVGGAVLFFAFQLIIPSIAHTFPRFLLYLLSEIPIFLAMNLVWIFADDYFTEQQGQRDYPKISAFGMLGVSAASVLILYGFGEVAWFKIDYLLGLCAVLFAVLTVFSLFLLRVCPALPKPPPDPFELDEELSIGTSWNPLTNFWNSFKADLQWANKVPFVKMFAWVTVANFVLLAIFDQTLANGSVNLDITPEMLSNDLSYWTLGFGIFSFFFLWFALPPLLNKQGVAKVNLFAPWLMFAGALSYIIFASDFLAPIWERTHLDPTAYALQFILGARIFGWAAEFLFNQSLLPLVYGALPSEEGNRARLFIEAPVTAITNGAVGLFLLGYFSIFKQGSQTYGYSLDLLFVIALVTAIGMVVGSYMMLPMFRDVLRQRAMESLAPGSMLSQYQVELSADASQLERALRNQQRGPQYVDLLKRLKGQAAVDELLDLVQGKQSSSDIATRAAVFKALQELNALQAFSKAAAAMAQHPQRFGPSDLDAFAQAAIHFGMQHDMQAVFRSLLKAQHIDTDLFRVMLKNLSRSGFEGAVLTSEIVQNRFRSLTETQDNPRASLKLHELQNLLEIAVEIRSDRFYPPLAKALRDLHAQDQLPDSVINWELFGQMRFFQHTYAYDALALLLERLNGVDSPAFRGANKLLQQHPWLCWPIVYLTRLPRKDLPEDLLSQRHLFVQLLATQAQPDWRWSSFQLYAAMRSEADQLENELSAIDWAVFDRLWLQKHCASIDEARDRFPFLDSVMAYVNRGPEEADDLGNFLGHTAALRMLAPEVAIDVKQALALTKQQLNRSLAMWFALRNHLKKRADWLKRRRLQWLQAHLNLLALAHPGARNSIFDHTALTLLTADPVRRDSALSLLEQSDIPRPTFLELRSQIEAEAQLLRKERNVADFDPDIAQPVDEDAAEKLWQRMVSHLYDPVLTAAFAHRT